MSEGGREEERERGFTIKEVCSKWSFRRWFVYFSHFAAWRGSAVPLDVPRMAGGQGSRQRLPDNVKEAESSSASPEPFGSCSAPCPAASFYLLLIIYFSDGPQQPHIGPHAVVVALPGQQQHLGAGTHTPEGRKACLVLIQR